MKLKLKLPMSSAMYVNLVNNYAKTTSACLNCCHPNGECINYAKTGTCNAMDKKINDILVFHDGEIEFATTRLALSKVLETNQDNNENPWLGETVDAIIEDYLSESKFGKRNSQASALYELLSSRDIIAECHHYGRYILI